MCRRVELQDVAHQYVACMYGSSTTGAAILYAHWVVLETYRLYVLCVMMSHASVSAPAYQTPFSTPAYFVFLNVTPLCIWVELCRACSCLLSVCDQSVYVCRLYTGRLCNTTPLCG